jgi:hypothetical protein
MTRTLTVSLLLFTMLIISDVAGAQEKKLIPLIPRAEEDTSRKVSGDTAEEKDLIDVLHSIFVKNYKPSKKDTIGRKPIISFVAAVGYSLQTRFAATITGNIVFRATPETKISTITTSMGFTQNKQFTLPIVSSIWTTNNEWVFIGDSRFYIYPQSTFGLGSASNIHDEDPMRYDFVRISEIAMKSVGGDFFLGAGYRLQLYWDITHEGPLNGAPSDYVAYGPQSHTSSSGFTLNGLFDTRDNSVNASKGFYAAMQFFDARTAFGSTSNWESLVIDVRKYHRFPEDSKNVIAFWSYDWVTLWGKPPYLDLPSTSWDPYSTTGRGYIQSRFRGTRMLYAEGEYRIGLSRNGLFGCVAFLNGQTFSAEPGTKFETIQPGFGGGLRVKLNKASNTNLAIDYGFGNQGSRGLFLTVGEVF